MLTVTLRTATRSPWVATFASYEALFRYTAAWVAQGFGAIHYRVNHTPRKD